MDQIAQAGRRILIIDDDDGMRTLMQAIFSPLSIKVEFAADGRTALGLLRAGDYDAVVLDLMLPAIDGFEVIRQVKAIKPALLPHTMILTAANKRTLGDFDDSKLVSCVMRKPFDLEDFVAAVLTCCGAPADAIDRPPAVVH